MPRTALVQMSRQAVAREWLDGRVAAELLDVVKDAWAVLFRDHAFTVAEAGGSSVLLTAPTLHIAVAHDPRGEVVVEVFPPGRERWQGWSYSGIVGRASVSRLLELALEAMQADPAVLQADPATYDGLAAKVKEQAKAWTAFASGHGPRPGKPHLP